MTRLFSLIILFTLSVKAYPQNDTLKIRNKNFPCISANYSYGNVIPTNEFVEGENLDSKPITSFQSLSLKMLWQNPGYTDWQKVYKGPYYGFGLFAGDFFSPDEIGYPFSLYGVLGIPIKRWENLELYSEFQIGITGNWQHYDSIANPKNIAIGGGLTAHIDIGIKAFYPIGKKLDMGASVSVTHFSNGGIERPNRGLNLCAPSIELKYHFAGRSDVRSIKPPGKLERSNDLYLMAGYGDYQIIEHELDTNYYAVGGLGAFYIMQHSNAVKSGPGVDFNFWWGLTANPDGTPGTIGWDNLTIGVIYQLEFAFNRLSLVGGIGNYARHLNYGNFKQFYQRLGVKYHFTENLSAGVNVRAINFMLAEFVEFNLGYRIRWIKYSEQQPG